MIIKKLFALFMENFNDIILMLSFPRWEGNIRNEAIKRTNRRKAYFPITTDLKMGLTVSRETPSTFGFITEEQCLYHGHVFTQPRVMQLGF